MKKIIAIIITVCISIGTILSLGGCGNNESPNWSRAEWITALGQTFGLDTYVSEETYFNDVSSDKACYKYVQSCVEWGILSNVEGKFKPNADASMEFALETALAAADVDLGEKTAIEFAIENGIIANDDYMSVKEKITVARAAHILDWAQALYVNQPIETKEYVDLVDTVKDYTQKEDIKLASENEYVISEEVASEMSAGDVFLAPGDAENPSGIACKVEEVKQNTDGSYTVVTSQPDLSEICEELEIATIVVPSAENAILSEGVKLIHDNELVNYTNGDVKAENLANIESISNYSHINIADTPKGENFTFSVNFTKGTVNVNREWKDILGLGESIKVGGEYPYEATSYPNSFEKTSVIPDVNLFGQDPYDNTDEIEAYKNGKISIDELKKSLDLNKDQTEKRAASMTNKFSGGYEVVGTIKIKDLYAVPEIKLKKNWLGVPVGIETLSATVNYEIESWEAKEYLCAYIEMVNWLQWWISDSRL